ncbi:MAG: hypothetical protein R3C53_26005, partial [Pirellulaceae bacterium]
GANGGCGRKEITASFVFISNDELLDISKELEIPHPFDGWKPGRVIHHTGCGNIDMGPYTAHPTWLWPKISEKAKANGQGNGTSHTFNRKWNCCKDVCSSGDFDVYPSYPQEPEEF